MVEESPVLLPPAEESIEAEPDTALEPEPDSGEPTPESSSEPGFVCACKESMRSACEGLPFYKEHESQRYCVLHYPAKEKSADFKAELDNKLNKKDFDFRGVWFPDDVDFSSFEFSAAADFSSAKFSAAADFSSATFSADANFFFARFAAAAYFKDASFGAAAYFFRARFGAAAYFNRATFGAFAAFNNATFSATADFNSAWFTTGAYFFYATFSAAADFGFARFSEIAGFSDTMFSEAADFSSARFSADADFKDVTFSAAAYFFSVKFSDTYFNLSVFHARTDFSRASFNGSVHFVGSATERLLKDGTSLAAMALGEDPSLDFQYVSIEHPERIAFYTLNLRPHWFVNVDSRQFVFTDVDWKWERISIKQEIAALVERVSSPNDLLAIACRQLAENAEANNRYGEASRFRYWAMDLARPKKWSGWSFWKTDWLHVLYWAVSGYGERIRRALGVLAAVWIVFALLYTWIGFTEQIRFPRALTYSLGVISLQKPEPRPLTTLAHTLVTLETILGPLQAALLALAIRRKFMR